MAIVLRASVALPGRCFYALTILAHTFLRLTGGVQANLRLGRVIIFHLSTECPADAPPNDNPGLKFTALCDTRLIVVEQAPWLPDYRQLAGGVLGEPGFCGDVAETTPAGLLPIVCLAEGATTVASSHFPVYNAVRHPEDVPLDAETVAAFRGLIRLFTTFVNNGVVFPPPPPGRPAPPVPGNMVRMRKGWKWQGIRTTWSRIFMGIMMQREGIPVFETALPVVDLWTRFWRW